MLGVCLRACFKVQFSGLNLCSFLPTECAHGTKQQAQASHPHCTVWRDVIQLAHNTMRELHNYTPLYTWSSVLQLLDSPQQTSTHIFFPVWMPLHFEGHYKRSAVYHFGHFYTPNSKCCIQTKIRWHLRWLLVLTRWTLHVQHCWWCCPHRDNLCVLS